MKKLISLLLALALPVCMLAGCGGESADDSKKDDSKEEAKSANVLPMSEAAASTDKYRNYYEIFTQSFADSDNDGTGDLQGIIDRLDYLNDGDPSGGDDLGVDGLWLTPIYPSESYHKYNIEHRLEKSEYNKKYREENKEKIAEKKRQYYLANREKILSKQKEGRKNKNITFNNV